MNHDRVLDMSAQVYLRGVERPLEYPSEGHSDGAL